MNSYNAEEAAFFRKCGASWGLLAEIFNCTWKEAESAVRHYNNQKAW